MYFKLAEAFHFSKENKGFLNATDYTYLIQVKLKIKKPYHC